jgi:hypothetical protein
MPNLVRLRHLITNYAQTALSASPPRTPFRLNHRHPLNQTARRAQATNNTKSIANQRRSKDSRSVNGTRPFRPNPITAHRPLEGPELSPERYMASNGRGERAEETWTCQSRLRRFFALFLRVVVSLMRFHSRPGPSFRFTTSSARVAQNAPPRSPPPAIGAGFDRRASSSSARRRRRRSERVQRKVWLWALVGLCVTCYSYYRVCGIVADGPNVSVAELVTLFHNFLDEIRFCNMRIRKKIIV